MEHRASTTGNIYGIYDMSGGAYEYVASYVDNKNGNITSSSYGGALGTSTDMRTKQVYKSASGDGTSDGSTDYILNSDIYGDAVYETSISYNSLSGSWRSDSSNFMQSHYPFCTRGGRHSSDSGSGMFCYGSYNGGCGNIGFRPVLCISSND